MAVLGNDHSHPKNVQGNTVIFSKIHTIDTLHFPGDGGIWELYDFKVQFNFCIVIAILCTMASKQVCEIYKYMYLFQLKS